MSETLVTGLLHRETEFTLIPGLGRIFGACGPCSLASATSAITNVVTHTDAVYQTMRQHGWCDPTGASTIGELQNAALALGHTVAAFQPYGEPWPGWAAFLNAHAGLHPVVVETANGQAFVDAISGLGENATNLAYHYVCVLGRNTGGWSPYAQRNLPAGCWVADGDNYAGGNNSANGFNAANVLQFYPDTVMASARLCAALALTGPLSGGKPMPIVPAGWHDDGTTLTAPPPNAFVCVKGIRDYILNHPGGWDPADIPLMTETGRDPVEYGNPSLGGGVYQLFLRSGQLSWTQARGVFATWNGQEMAALLNLAANASSLQKELADAQAQLTAANNRIAAAKAALG